MKRSFVLIISLVAAFFVPTAPAEAVGAVVYVQADVGNQIGNLKRGAKFVDKYTATRFVFGNCRYGNRCVVVRIDKSRKAGTAWASWNGGQRGTVSISVNPARGSSYMTRLFAHEIGHAMFLGHSKARTNLMYPTLHKKNGGLVPMRFTKSQIQTLRKH